MLNGELPKLASRKCPEEECGRSPIPQREASALLWVRERCQPLLGIPSREPSIGAGVCRHAGEELVVMLNVRLVGRARGAGDPGSIPPAVSQL